MSFQMIRQIMEGVQARSITLEGVPVEDALSPAAYWLEGLHRSRGYRHIFVVGIDTLESLPHP